MADLQTQARALGDPTRHEIFNYIAGSKQLVDVAELTQHFGFNHNAIRQHLAKLVDASLICESSTQTTGRGRPRLCYSISPAAQSRWGAIGPYERLSQLLTEVIHTQDTPAEVGRRAGKTIPTKNDESTDPVDELVDAMASQGFDPSVKRKGKKIDITFGTCPFETSAKVDPDTVCEIHRGLTIGAAESLGSIVIDDHIHRDPEKGKCAVRCHVEG